MREANDAVLRAVESTLLHPKVLEKAVAHAERVILQQRNSGDLEAVEAELAEATKALRRLRTAIAKGNGDLDDLVAKMRSEKQHVAELQTRVNALKSRLLRSTGSNCGNCYV
jgi:peptidoglycan hydrolase CwlO-like protein